jgi:hypothetical protein
MTRTIRAGAGVLVAVAMLAMASPAAAQWWNPRGTPPRSSGSYDGPSSGTEPERARVIALLSTIVPVGAGSLTWAVQGDVSVTSWVLIYFGSVEGPAIGYRFANMNRSAAEGEALRGIISLATLAIGLDRKAEGDRIAVLAAGSALVTGLAIYDSNRLPDRASRVRYGTRVDLHPALIGAQVVPAVTVHF